MSSVGLNQSYLAGSVFVKLEPTLASASSVELDVVVNIGPAGLATELDDVMEGAAAATFVASGRGAAWPIMAGLAKERVDVELPVALAPTAGALVRGALAFALSGTRTGP